MKGIIQSIQKQQVLDRVTPISNQKTSMVKRTSSAQQFQNKTPFQSPVNKNGIAIFQKNLNNQIKQYDSDQKQFQQNFYTNQHLENKNTNKFIQKNSQKIDNFQSIKNIQQQQQNIQQIKNYQTNIQYLQKDQIYQNLLQDKNFIENQKVTQLNNFQSQQNSINNYSQIKSQNFQELSKQQQDSQIKSPQQNQSMIISTQDNIAPSNNITKQFIAHQNIDYLGPLNSLTEQNSQLYLEIEKLKQELFNTQTELKLQDQQIQIQNKTIEQLKNENKIQFSKFLLLKKENLQLQMLKTPQKNEKQRNFKKSESNHELLNKNEQNQYCKLEKQQQNQEKSMVQNENINDNTQILKSNILESHILIDQFNDGISMEL